jgi:hypothetical protein
MLLGRSTTLTPALVASHCRNAKKSTGPRAARGKAWSRLNRLRNGWRWREFFISLKAVLDAPPGQVELTAQALLASRQAHHPVFSEIAEMSVQTENDICNGSRWSRAERKS